MIHPSQTGTYISLGVSSFSLSIPRVIMVRFFLRSILVVSRSLVSFFPAPSNISAVVFRRGCLALTFHTCNLVVVLTNLSLWRIHVACPLYVLDLNAPFRKKIVFHFKRSDFDLRCTSEKFLRNFSNCLAIH